MEWLIFGFLIFVVIVLLVSGITNSSRRKEAEAEKRLEDYIKRTRIQEAIILENEQRIESFRMDNKVNLTQTQMEALDIYEQSNIKIPVEIIEDLHAHRITQPDEIMEFIENQRHFWKLENTKKPYRKKVK